jgi:NAD(P)-dependent dehydrogenase (short-subunit alcohol dehydrogenase family)
MPSSPKVLTRPINLGYSSTRQGVKSLKRSTIDHILISTNHFWFHAHFRHAEKRRPGTVGFPEQHDVSYCRLSLLLLNVRQHCPETADRYDSDVVKYKIGGMLMRATGGLRTFSGSVAVITGGASGIGRALAQELATRGSEVVLADLQVEQAQEVASDICASGGRATAMEADVTDYAALERVVHQTVQRTGRLDHMFNNAGIGIVGNVCHYNIEDWHYILDVNLRGVINGVQAAYGVMTDQGFGHIVNTASFAGMVSCPGMVSYATTKHAVLGLSISLRGEAKSKGIRVSVLCPGFIRTAILEDGGKYGKTLIELSGEQRRLISKMIDKMRPMDPALFARKALNSVAKNRAVIVWPKSYHVFWWINRLFPSLGMFLGQQSFQNNQKKLGIV